MLTISTNSDKKQNLQGTDFNKKAKETIGTFKMCNHEQYE